MNDSIPKRQHFVAQMLLERFTDDDGKLFFFNKRFPAKGVLTGTPRSLFFENDLYTAKDKHGTLDVELERYYADMEGQANLIIEKILISARNSRTPQLTASEKSFWDFFFYNQWKRVPDFQRKFFETEKVDFQLNELTAAFETSVRPLTPEEKRDLQNPVWLKRVKQNAMVVALKHPSERILTFLREKGLGIAVILKPGKSFVIGSFPIAKMAYQGRQHPSDSTVEMWFPVAHDVAVSPAPIASTAERLVEIHDHSPVRAINTAIFRQSTAIAGRSRELIASLAHSR